MKIVSDDKVGSPVEETGSFLSLSHAHEHFPHQYKYLSIYFCKYHPTKAHTLGS